MKVGWEEKALGDIVTLHYGKPLPRSERYEDGKFAVYGANGIKSYSDKYFADGPSIIVGRKGSAGEINIAPDKFWPLDVTYFTEHDPKNVDFGFLKYLLKMQDLPSLATGVKPGINRNLVYALNIPLPPLEEQKRIVAVLDAAFEGLDRARAHVVANLQNALDLFESILAQTLRDKFPFVSTVKLGEVCELAQGLAINKKSKHLLVKKSSKPLLRIKDLRNGLVEQYVAETGYPPKAEVTKTDIIYTRTGQIGLVFRGFEGILHNNCFSVRSGTGLSQGYCYWWLQEPLFKKTIVELASRAAQPDITHKIFKAQTIRLPSNQDQAEAVSILENEFENTEKLKLDYQAKLTDLDDLRQSLLQKAFAGELT